MSDEGNKSMPLEQRINQVLKEAMYAKDQQTADCVRMIKTKITEKRTSPGFKGEINDELVQEVIAAYQKQLRKALEEYQSTGDRGAEMREQLAFEIGFCDKFLPQKLGEAEVRKLVAEAVGKLPSKDPKMTGRVMGEILKAHKGQVDSTMLKKLIEEALK
jgi:uncharacterized protein YqeY